MTNNNQNKTNQPKGEIEHVEVAAVETNAIEAMERASMDVQIATANKYPRSLTTFYKKAEDMIRLDPETAERCIYHRPVGKGPDGRQKIVEGESIRLAEIVAAAYGNLRVGGVITEITTRHVKAIGFAHDLETNYAAKSEVIESTVTKHGVPFSERMRVVVSKAAQKKAIRDAIFSVIPKVMCKRLVKIAMDVAKGGKTIEQIRDSILVWIKEIKVSPERVYMALGVTGNDDIGMTQVMHLAGLRTAIDDGDCTVAEAFPPLEEEKTAKSPATRIKDKFAKPKRGPGRPKKKKEEPSVEPTNIPDATIETDTTSKEVEEAPETPQDGQTPVEETQTAPKLEKEQQRQAKKAATEKPVDKFKCTRCNRTMAETKDGFCLYCLGKCEEI